MLLKIASHPGPRKCAHCSQSLPQWGDAAWLCRHSIASFPYSVVSLLPARIGIQHQHFPTSQWWSVFLLFRLGAGGGCFFVCICSDNLIYLGSSYEYHLVIFLAFSKNRCFFQLHTAMVYNKIYIAAFMPEIMMKLNGPPQSNKSLSPI